MKKLLLSFYFTFCILHFSFAQNPLVKQWDKRFGGTNGELLFSFQQTADGGFILGGYSYSDSSGDKSQNNRGLSDYWIVKTDLLGNKQWDKDFGGDSIDYLYSIQQTTDGGFILGGMSRSGSNGDKTQPSWGNYDYWIVKVDSLGNKQWDKDFGGTDVEYLYSLKQTSDGGYILGGVSFSGISGDKTQPTWGVFDYWIVKTDSLGNKQWDRDFGGTNYDYLASLYQTSDGGYILGGFSSSGISGDKTQSSWGSDDYWIIKIDSLGNKQWDKDFGGTSNDKLLSLQQTTDYGYILGGISRSPVSGDKTQPSFGDGDYWIVKVDSLGNKQWDKDFGGTDDEDEFGYVSQTNDSGYLISGASYSNIGGNKTENNLGVEQIWILKTDSSGTIQWEKTIFTTGHDEQGMAVQTKDGCYAMVNYTDAGIGGYKTEPGWDTIPPISLADYWIVKFCDTTSTTSINQLPQLPKSSFTLYPNPADKELRIKNAALRIKEIEIVDLFGRTVLKSEVGGQKSEVRINVSSLSPGIYFLKAGNEVRKFVKE